MYRYLATVSYDGSKFKGFQRLKDNKSVQSNIERAFKILFNQDIKIKGAGRTDAKVHAYGQRFHFDLERFFEFDKLQSMLNRVTDNSIYISKIQKVDVDFSARYNAVSKIYVYKIYFGKYNPFMNDYAFYIKNKLNIKKMKNAAKLFIGCHDFEYFVSSKKKSNIATIKKITIKTNDNITQIMVEGDHFYQYMVRNIVGALIEVGKGKKECKDIEDLLLKKKSTPLSTAYPQGLYLVKIKY